METASLALLTVVIALLTFLIFKDVKRPRGFPPGPTWFPLLGCLPQVRSALARLGFHHLVWTELARKYGRLVGLRLGKDRVVVVSGHEAVKHVLAREDCDARPDGFFFRIRTFNERLGLAFTDGVGWQQHRSFSARHMRQLGLSRDAMEQLVLEEVQTLVLTLRQKCHAGQGTEVSLHDLCAVGVINSLWSVVAGRRYDLEDERPARLLALVTNFFKFFDMSGGLLTQVPVLRFLAPELTGYNRLMTTIYGLQDFMRDTIKEHQNSMVPGETRDVIDAYLQEMNTKSDDSEFTFTENQLLALSMDLFMAGSETTSNTLAFLVLLLLHHPETQQRLQRDVDAVVGRARLPALADRPLLPYVDAYILEAQRFVTIAPTTLAHRTTKDCDILGYHVPKDTMLLPSLYSVHMDPEYWGDPETFRPERFLDEGGEKIVKHDEGFMPFGLGKRRCLGEALAKASLFLFFAGLLQNFNFDLVPGQQPPTLTPLDGMTLSAQPFTGIVTVRKA